MAKAYPKITITGDLGSGKSAVSKYLESELGFPIYSTGKIQREIAEKYGMTTLELNRYAETHPEIDDEIDDFSKDLGKQDRSVIVDSRLAWFFMPTSFKIYMTVTPDEAVRRIMGDQRQSESYASPEEAKEKIAARKKSENERFLELYGADCADMGNFDLVVDTTGRSIDEVKDHILNAFQQWRAA